MMKAAQPEQLLRLVDQADGPGRTTATLIASLAGRLAALHYVTGADAIGALTAGFAALGREVSRTAEGLRLRQAIEAGRSGANGQALWQALHIEEWASGMAPAPVLDQLRNDLALLLADDLEATLELLPIPNRMAGTQDAEPPAPATFVDCLLGLWVYARELQCAIETLAAPTLLPAGSFKASAATEPEPGGSLLR